MLSDIDALPLPDTRRLVTTGGHFAYLKIAEGCDKHCTYCIIPKIRGNYRSVPMERLIKEAEYLAEQGVKELILVAQETTLYGRDIYGEKSLHRLIRELCRIRGNPVDQDSLLLSRGDYGRAYTGHEGRAESMPLP